MKELIEQGYIYIAQPAFIFIEKGNKKNVCLQRERKEAKTLEMAPDGKGVESTAL